MYEAGLKVALKLIIVSASKRKHKRLRLIPSDNSEIKYLIPRECWEDQAVAIKMVPKGHQMHQVPIIPPFDLVITTVEERGRPSDLESGQLEIARGLLGLVMSSPPSPGCWILINSVRLSGVKAIPVISHPRGPVKKRRYSIGAGQGRYHLVIPHPFIRLFINRTGGDISLYSTARRGD